MHTMTAQVLTTLTCAKMPAVEPIIASALSAPKSTQWRRQRMSFPSMKTVFTWKGLENAQDFMIHTLWPIAPKDELHLWYSILSTIFLNILVFVILDH